MNLGHRAYAESLDQLHVFAFVAAHDAECKVHASGKGAQQLGIRCAVGVFCRREKHRYGAVFGGLRDLGLKIFSGNLYYFSHMLNIERYELGALPL